MPAASLSFHNPDRPVCSPAPESVTKARTIGTEIMRMKTKRILSLLSATVTEGLSLKKGAM